MKRQKRFCDGTSRRDMLRYGAAGLFGMGVTLPQLLQQKAIAAEKGKSTSDVSLIIVFLQGRHTFCKIAAFRFSSVFL